MALDLDAISAALQDVAATSGADGRATREPCSAEVIRWMVDGYALLDELVERGVDIFTINGARSLLQLNERVLFGKAEARRADYAAALEMSRQRFLTSHDEGAGGFCAWAAVARGSSPERFAAAAFVRIVSAPQLFVEGNQRTATLVASHALLCAGRPPLVATVETWRRFTRASAFARSVRRDALHGPVAGWLARRKVAAVQRDMLDPRFVRATVPPGAAG